MSKEESVSSLEDNVGCYVGRLCVGIDREIGFGDNDIINFGVMNVCGEGEFIVGEG